ncbi:hypothetical protein EVAR_73475_1 [Eumeta japonica]|uniref:Uncharacterized protein n=1 Tax=Eumeta variegata TaxID=151549 RepID=A0A4C1SPM1_EUMVA|nr:hypothetical protein EVAR_73475_1 [Eumeta japonica]
MIRSTDRRFTKPEVINEIQPKAEMKRDNVFRDEVQSEGSSPRRTTEIVLKQNKKVERFFVKVEKALCALVDLEKAYDRVERNDLWRTLSIHGSSFFWSNPNACAGSIILFWRGVVLRDNAQTSPIMSEVANLKIDSEDVTMKYCPKTLENKDTETGALKSSKNLSQDSIGKKLSGRKPRTLAALVVSNATP